MLEIILKKYYKLLEKMLLELSEKELKKQEITLNFSGGIVKIYLNNEK